MNTDRSVSGPASDGATGKAIVGSVLWVLIGAAAVYLAALGYLWATQRSHVFHPGIGPLDLINSTVASYMRDERSAPATGWR